MAVSTSPSFSEVAAELGISLPKSLAQLVAASTLSDQTAPHDLLAFSGYVHGNPPGYPFVQSLTYQETYDRFLFTAYMEGADSTSAALWDFNVAGSGYQPETGTRVLYGSGGTFEGTGSGTVYAYSGGILLSSGYGGYTQPPNNKAVYMVGRSAQNIADGNAGIWSSWGNQKPYTIPGSGG